MKNSITDIRGITVGSVEDRNALTGCTVILTGEEGCICGVDVRGSAPGTREIDLLSPINSVDKVHAVLLSGGSAYGLDAAGGIMAYLEEKHTGFQVGPTVVPIVPAAVLFDLLVGDYRVRPDKKMGYAACQAASEQVKEGNYGAGMGATVGKIRGYEFCTKSGQGTASIKLQNGLIVGAIVAVNAFGDIIDPQDGRIIAGVRGENGGFKSSAQIWKDMADIDPFHQVSSTTIAVVACNAKFDKARATKIAQMAHNGLARSIYPVHTMYDGDAIFALSAGDIEADVNVVGILAQEVLARAVLRAVYAAETVQGIVSS